MHIWLNVGSIMLGLIAWILPIINLVRPNKDKNKSWTLLSMVSISACVIALWFQILYNNHLVNVEDWSAIMDISEGITRISFILAIITLVLNAITVMVYTKKRV
jgi:cytochrome c oxidase subunit 4